MLTERSLYILQKLIYTGKVYKISAFAHHFDVSVRSIQYDLNRISDFLADYSFPALERPTGSSISYHLKASQEERLLELLRICKLQRAAMLFNHIFLFLHIWIWGAYCG